MCARAHTCTHVSIAAAAADVGHYPLLSPRGLAVGEDGGGAEWWEKMGGGVEMRWWEGLNIFRVCACVCVDGEEEEEEEEKAGANRKE